MSYILDALKRADAERVRGQVPGLHAQPLNEAGTDERGSAAPRWALWGGLAVGVVVVAALAWRMGADANAPVPAHLPTPPAPTPAPEPLAQAAAPAPTVAQAPVPAATTPVIPSYAPVPEAASAKPAIKDSRPAAAPSPAQTSPTQQPPAQPAAAPANARVPLLSELPASLRQQLPQLTVSGSVYSDDAASRFIMLNGDVVKEGAQPAPGLFIERIEPKSAVLRYKGERFRLPF